MSLAGWVAAAGVWAWISVPGGAWIPSKEELFALGERLEAEVRRGADEAGVVLRPWDRYTFQILGELVGSRRLILVNAFCIEPPAYSRERLVLVLDGGACFWQVHYDPATGEYLELRFNGEG